jgi:hypothetical protein
MKTVLILNHKKVKCGTYQICKRVFNNSVKSKLISFLYDEVDNLSEYKQALVKHHPDYIIYNWHWDRMPWLKDGHIENNKLIKHYFIYHDGSMMKAYDKYLFFGVLDPNMTDVPDDKRILLPRPLLKYNGEYPSNDIVNIGSFGFAFNHKNFDWVAPYIGNQFKHAVVNLHFTNPYFGDTPDNKIADIIGRCYLSNTNPNIKLNITTNFMDDNDLLKFLAGNDLNLFMYNPAQQNPGISSAIDYALSVRRPIAISHNMMFRHIMSDEILIEKNFLKDIISRGIMPLEKFYSLWSIDNFTSEMERLFL